MIYKITDYNGDLQALFNQIEINDDQWPVIHLEGQRVNVANCHLPTPKANRQARVIGSMAIIDVLQNHDGIVPHPSVRGLSVSLGVTGGSIVNTIERWDWDGLVFTGGRNQLQLVAQYGSRITNCQFLHGKRGIHAIFCLQPVIESCKFQFQDVEGVCLRTGVSDLTLLTEWGVGDEDDNIWFSNPTTTNSQSNRAVINHCRFFGKNAQKCFVRVQGSDGVVINNPVFEGGAPDYCVYADSRNSNTVRDIEINRPHVEISHNNAVSIFYFRAFQKAIVRSMYSQVAHTTHITEEDCGQIYMDNLNFMRWDSDTFNGGDKCEWYFHNPQAGYVNFAASKIWANGLPDYLRVDNAQGVFNLGKKGGKFVARIGSDETSLRIAKNIVDVRGVKTAFIPADANIIEK